ncbi:hypothetical protein O3Q52_47710 [Streptomyces sp. ActVer]|uniref:hypothetical protein n=1 Tax=Streptomyces sp. ActVer TaxID=3014558 RepID=UPI0022B3F040|nr:hypothetical protein [Streptomyces sp. ActVer]MCZ4515670.1 hypothetical protein [Streptomyces sp. ActVer]
MRHGTILRTDALTTARITKLWNEVIPSMIEGLDTDLFYAKEESTVGTEDLKILDGTLNRLRRLDSGELQAEPSDVRDAVQAWLAYFFRSAETPVGMNLAPVYRLAAELSDAAEAIERERLATVSTDPWTAAEQECHNVLCGLVNKELVHVGH